MRYIAFKIFIVVSATLGAYASASYINLPDAELSERQFYRSPGQERDSRTAARKQRVKRCKEKRALYFWRDLDKKQFVEIKRQYIISKNDSYPELFAEDWQKFLKRFGCRYFSIQRAVDLNGDGIKELLVEGEYGGYKYDVEWFVFRRESDRWRVVLFHVGDSVKVGWGKSKRFKNLVISTSFSGSERYLNTFSFNGRYYEESECISESYAVRAGGEILVNDYLTVKLEKCSNWFSRHIEKAK